MVRLKSTGIVLVVLLAACSPAKPAVQPPQMLDRAVTEWSPAWVKASIYDESALNDEQRHAVSLLEPAGGEGRVGLGFTEDFDGDGRAETICYGTYTKSNEEGNFVLVTRKETDRTAVLLLQEFPGVPKLTVFTLKPDGSLWFGGGIDAGEVTMNITWDQGSPILHRLTGD